jgi:RHS repeat-associated protein
VGEVREVSRWGQSFKEWQMRIPFALTKLVSWGIRAVFLAYGLATVVLPAQERFRLADPQTLSASGSGWSVDPRTGGLSIVMPVGQIGGEIPIPVTLRLNGQFKRQELFCEVGESASEDITGPVSWRYDGIKDFVRPVYGTINFGYIGLCPHYDGDQNFEWIVLESGLQLRSDDFVQFLRYNNEFSLPQDFGFSARTASSVKISNRGSHVLYSATSSEFGLTWQAKIQSLVPVGYGNIQDLYRVVMDKDIARVFACLPGTGTWAPIFWVDRFGHWVGFKWKKMGQDLPSGVNGAYSLEIADSRSRGVLLSWASFDRQDQIQDLLRAQFVGVDAPCILVRGYPDATYSLPQGVSSNNRALASIFNKLYIAGPTGRPTLVQIGDSSQIPFCSWANSVPMSSGMASVGPKQTGMIPILTWEFFYDESLAIIKKMKDAYGVETEFSYEQIEIGTTQSSNLNGNQLNRQNEINSSQSSAWNDDLLERVRYSPGNLYAFGVASAISVDPKTSRAMYRAWERDVVPPGNPHVKYKESDSSPNLPQRWTEYIYTGKASNGRDYSNGALEEVKIFTPGKTDPIYSCRYDITGAGLDKTYSLATGFTVIKDGEPKSVVVYQLSFNDLTFGSQTVFVGNNLFKAYANQVGYLARMDRLDVLRVKSNTYTVWNNSGTPQSYMTDFEYSELNGLLLRAYERDSNGDLRGASFSYDTEGRLISKKSVPELAISTLKSYVYDAKTGYLSAQNTTYHNGDASAPTTLFQSFSDYDSAGRPQTITDERNLVTHQRFDGLGRLVESQNAIGVTTYIHYPSLTQRNTTQGDISINEETDGFGRTIKRTRPDGSWDEMTYDMYGRLETTRRYSRLGDAQGAASTSYDALDRPIDIVSSENVSQHFDYSVDSRFPTLSLVTRTMVTPNRSVVTKEYRDALGRVVRQESALGDITESTYDGRGNLVQVVLTPAGGGTAQVRKFVYDAQGRMTERNEPETGVTRFTAFDPSGQPTRIEEADGRVRTLTYDGLGRLVEVKGGQEQQTYTYQGADLVGMVSVSNGVTVSQRFEYKGPGKQLSLEETVQPGKTFQIGYGYDPSSGLLNTITYPNGRLVEYRRDALGRVTSILNNKQPIVENVSFDPWGNREQLRFASGASSDWSYAKTGLRLESWAIRHNSASLDGPHSYRYDDAERLTSAGIWDSISHDAQGRLLTANSSELGVNTSHGHDAFGNNILHQYTGNVPAGVMNNFNFPALPSNQLPSTTLNGALTGWEANGRGEATRMGVGVASRDDLCFAWDGLGRLKSVARQGRGPNAQSAGTQSYLYAPSGMRVALFDTQTPTNNRRYAYTASGLLLGEYTEAPAKALTATRAVAANNSATRMRSNVQTRTTEQGLVYAAVLPDIDPVELDAWIEEPLGPTTVQVGQSLVFRGAASGATSYRWFFGDGTSATGLRATKAYTAAGTYTVNFRASKLKDYASATVQITVVPVGPVIRSFKASQGVLPEGGTATLSWEVSGATAISLTEAAAGQPTLNRAVSPIASSGVSPAKTTTYTLTATGGGQTVSSSVTVTVVPKPVILAFLPDSSRIQPGQSTTLRWAVTNATSCSLDQGIGTVKEGWVQVWPGATTTFRLTATNQAQGFTLTSTATATITLGDSSGVEWKRDVIYLGTEAVAEIDALGVHELHNDHLGSPLVVTNGATAQIEGRQVFGPYGELLKTDGSYKPLTGYTGHLQQDTTGLIYMRGRFYSPAWHRFLNSDQGVDPNSWNQMAYVGGSPFQAVDPSGKSILRLCMTIIEYEDNNQNNAFDDGDYKFRSTKTCWYIGGNDDGESEAHRGGGGSGYKVMQAQTLKYDSPCAKLKAAGVTKGDWSRMVESYNSMVQNNSNTKLPMREYGFSRLGGHYFDAPPDYNKYRENAAGRGFWWGLGGTDLNVTSGSAGIDFHVHFDPGPGKYTFKGINSVSLDDMILAKRYLDNDVNMMMVAGSATMLYQFDHKGNSWPIAGPGWWNLNCF